MVLACRIDGVVGLHAAKIRKDLRLWLARQALSGTQTFHHRLLNVVGGIELGGNPGGSLRLGPQLQRGPQSLKQLGPSVGFWHGKPPNHSSVATADTLRKKRASRWLA